MTHQVFREGRVLTGWLSKDEQRAWRDLLEMTDRLTARLARELQDAAGLSQADYGVLVALTDAPRGRRRVFELQSDLRWEQSRLSHQLTRMERRGLVRKGTCTTDRRGAVITVTAAGRAAIRAAASAHVASVRRLVFDDLTDRQLDCLQAVLTQVLGRLDEAG
jgi:DNA-binding MarR family transcriptional regulator